MMRIVITLTLLLLITAPGLAQDRLNSPYRHQAETGLRGLDEKEIADLKAGMGMGLARAAELNSYPGPRHVLDAIEEGKLPASREQLERIQQVFNTMNRDAVSVGGKILAEEQILEAGFRSATMTDVDLRSRVARIAVLQGELRAIHLAAHIVTRRILSEAQIARYNEVRGYTAAEDKHEGQQHKH
jgi:hypothetical protein